jgi:hypothetical protein
MFAVQKTTKARTPTDLAAKGLPVVQHAASAGCC